MSYWRRPKFWLLLAAAEVAAFGVSAVITTVIFLGFSIAGVSQHVHFWSYCIGIPVHAFLAWDAFRWVRASARRWPQPPGFAVLTATPSGNAGQSHGDR